MCREKLFLWESEQLCVQRKIVLLVNGENKAEILKEVVNGPVTPKVPGSILQFHPHVTVICDEEAAKYL